MKTFAKAVLGSVMLTGAAIGAAIPAQARVSVSLNLGLFAPAVPAPVVAPLPGYCYGPTYYAACTHPVYSTPVFWDGIWFNNAPYRIVGGRREFWVHGGWHTAQVGGHASFRR